MKRIITATALLATTVLGGCLKPDGADGARDALPAASAVQIRLPGAAALVADDDANSDGIAHDALAVLGQTAEFYGFTRGISRELNGGAAFVLLLVKAITDYPVTSMEGNTFIWGPWSEALNPSEFRLTVTETVSGTFDWSLEGRRKADGPGAPYLAVVAGAATPGATPNRGTGAFTMDFDVAEALDPAGNDAQGQLDVSYDLESDPRSIVMDYATLQPAPGGGEESVTLHYEYAEAGDGSGDFQFTLHGDLDDNGSAWEDTEVRSRWLATGAGRSDVRIQGGDLGAIVVEGSECWDGTFSRIYWTDNQNWVPTEGDAAACAFSSPSYPGQ